MCQAYTPWPEEVPARRDCSPGCSDPPSIVLALVAAKSRREGGCELISCSPPVATRSSVLHERSQLRLRTSASSSAAVYERVRPAKRCSRASDENDVDECPRIVIPAHATGVPRGHVQHASPAAGIAAKFVAPSAASTPPLRRGHACTPSRLRSADALRGLITRGERGRSPRRAPQPKPALFS